MAKFFTVVSLVAYHLYQRSTNTPTEQPELIEATRALNGLVSSQTALTSQLDRYATSFERFEAALGIPTSPLALDAPPEPEVAPDTPQRSPMVFIANYYSALMRLGLTPGVPPDQLAADRAIVTFGIGGGDAAAAVVAAWALLALYAAHLAWPVVSAVLRVELIQLATYAVSLWYEARSIARLVVQYDWANETNRHALKWVLARSRRARSAAAWVAFAVEFTTLAVGFMRDSAAGVRSMVSLMRIKVHNHMPEPMQPETPQKYQTAPKHVPQLKKIKHATFSDLVVVHSTPMPVTPLPVTPLPTMRLPVESLPVTPFRIDAQQFHSSELPLLQLPAASSPSFAPSPSPLVLPPAYIRRPLQPLTSGPQTPRKRAKPQKIPNNPRPTSSPRPQSYHHTQNTHQAPETPETRAVQFTPQPPVQPAPATVSPTRPASAEITQPQNTRAQLQAQLPLSDTEALHKAAAIRASLDAAPGELELSICHLADLYAECMAVLGANTAEKVMQYELLRALHLVDSHAAETGPDQCAIIARRLLDAGRDRAAGRSAEMARLGAELGRLADTQRSILAGKGLCVPVQWTLRALGFGSDELPRLLDQIVEVSAKITGTPATSQKLDPALVAVSHRIVAAQHEIAAHVARHRRLCTVERETLHTTLRAYIKVAKSVYGLHSEMEASVVQSQLRERLNDLNLKTEGIIRPAAELAKMGLRRSSERRSARSEWNEWSGPRGELRDELRGEMHESFGVRVRP